MIYELSEYVMHKLLHCKLVYKVDKHIVHHKNYNSMLYYYINYHMFYELISVFLFIYSIYNFNLILLFISLYSCMYNFVHQIQHTKKLRTIFPILTTYHKLHHKQLNLNIGITSPLCDIIFGTLHPDFIFKKNLLSYIFLFIPILSFYSLKLR